MPEVSSGAVTFQFQCSSESTNGTGVECGQIPELLFYGPGMDDPGEKSNEEAKAKGEESSELNKSPSKTSAQKQQVNEAAVAAANVSKLGQKESPGNAKSDS